MTEFVYNSTTVGSNGMFLNHSQRHGHHHHHHHHNSSLSDTLQGEGHVEVQQQQQQQMNSDVQILIIFLYSIVCLVAIVGNACVIYLVVSRRRMRNVTNYFIASLAVSDTLMAIVCIPVTFVANVLLDYWPFPAMFCPLVTYLQAVVVFQNAYVMLAISMERYIAIMYPFRRRLTTFQGFLVIAFCWFLSFGTPLPTAIVSQLETFNVNESKSRCLEIWPSVSQRFTYTVTIMVLQYFVPLMVLIYTYARIVHVVWLKEVPPHGPFGPTVLVHRESTAGVDMETGRLVDPRKKVIKMMITVVGIYTICWLPLHVITILGDTNTSIWNYPYIMYIWVTAHWLAMSSCMYNPLIYWWMNQKFREGYKSLLRNIKLYCCMRGRDRVNLMMDSRGTYNSTHSRNNDHALNCYQHDVIPMESQEETAKKYNVPPSAEMNGGTHHQTSADVDERVSLRQVSNVGESGLGSDDEGSDEVKIASL